MVIDSVVADFASVYYWSSIGPYVGHGYEGTVIRWGWEHET